jgi:ABC-2 type transport system ATP-binding protein
MVEKSATVVPELSLGSGCVWRGGASYAEAMSEPAIEVQGLRKSYGAVEAVRGVDLEVETGEIFALLGPNGAGKTTTVEILEGHRPRTAGDVSVLGHDPAKRELALRRRIGIVLQETGVEPFLTVSETIELYRRYYPDPLPLDEVIEVVGLGDKKDSPVKKLSGGQQRRLDVAVGLSGNPELLFLDEPTTGFDPSARRRAWGMVENLKALGKTVLLTTHYMDEAQHLADRVAIIVQGAIVANGPPGVVAGRNNRALIRFVLGAEIALPDRLAELAKVDRRRVEVDSSDPTRDLNELTTWALAENMELQDLTVSRASLEEIFLELAGGDPA